MVKSKYILLIGGAGYIGSVICKDFLEKGYKVRILDNLIYNNKPPKIKKKYKKKFDFVLGDFRNKIFLTKSLKNVDSVIFLAGLVGDPITKLYPKESRNINYYGIIKALNLIKNKNISRLIFVSTCSNYGLKNVKYLAKENSILKPLSLYAKSKTKIEKYLLENKNQFDYEFIILRFATAFGYSSRMRFDLTVNDFVRQLILGYTLEIYDPNTWRPYCHVKDFSRIMIKFIKAKKNIVNGQVFNCGDSKNNYTKMGILREILKLLPKAKYKIIKKIDSDKRDYRVDFTKIQKTLNFKSNYSLKYGIKEILSKTKFIKKKISNKFLEQFGNFKIYKKV